MSQPKQDCPGRNADETSIINQKNQDPNMKIATSTRGEEKTIAKSEFIVLQILNKGRKAMYGMEILKQSNKQITKGGIYVTLSRMQKKGLITSEKESVIQPGLTAKRRLYTITKSGIEASQDYKDELLEFTNSGVFTT